MARTKGAHLQYAPHYTDLDRAIRELGTQEVLRMINRCLHYAGMARKRWQLRERERHTREMNSV